MIWFNWTVTSGTLVSVIYNSLEVLSQLGLCLHTRGKSGSNDGHVGGAGGAVVTCVFRVPLSGVSWRLKARVVHGWVGGSYSLAPTISVAGLFGGSSPDQAIAAYSSDHNRLVIDEDHQGEERKKREAEEEERRKSFQFYYAQYVV